MKKILRYSLLITALLAGSRAFSQELVYEQDHGLSFTKGTINTDVLLQLVQQKQEELNQFLLSDLVQQSVLNPRKEGDHPSRLDNFVTKYLVYSTLNALTVTADKRQFGKNTLQLLKEASLLFGLAGTVNGSFYVQDMYEGKNRNFLSVDNAFQLDSISFNRTLDMVLNICITNPQLADYFPLYGVVNDPSSDVQTWYDHESAYYPYRNDSLVAAQYQEVEEKVNALFSIVQTLRSARSLRPQDRVVTLIDSLAPQLTTLIVPAQSQAAQTINHILGEIDSTRAIIRELQTCFGTRIKGADSFVWRDSVLRNFQQLVYNYNRWKSANEQQFDAKKLDTLFAGLKRRGAAIQAPAGPLNKVQKTLNEELQRNKRVPQSSVLRQLNELKRAKGAEKWKTLLETNAVYTWVGNDHLSRVDTLVDQLKRLADRAEMMRQLLVVFAQQVDSLDLGHFTFSAPQLEASKSLMEEFIAYIDKSGKFNVASVFLRSVADNIDYQPAVKDSVKGSVSLGFESLLFTLNEKLVLPGKTYRTRYIQPYVHIGVNYADFVGLNQLQTADDGSTSALRAMSFASEKIGVKLKLWNWSYTHSFKPGSVYRYYRTDRLWLRPAKKPFISDWFMDVHAGGLLYNAVNLNTEKTFNFPFAGAGTGVKTFNGLSVSVSYNFPFTNGLAESGGWRTNGFVMLSLDIPIIEYIGALRNK